VIGTGSIIGLGNDEVVNVEGGWDGPGMGVKRAVSLSGKVGPGMVVARMISPK
jgi:hypothetical protein